MSALGVVALVAGILLLNLLLWLPALAWMNRRTGQLVQELRRDLEAAGERLVLPPTPILYRGATSGSGRPRVKGNGVAALTDRRLVLRKLVGRGCDVPVGELAGVREDAWFLRAYRSGRPHVIVKTRDGSEVGFIVSSSHEEWMRALSTTIDTPRAA